MSLTVNTNMQALRIQRNLASSTDRMNTAMERMSSGSKINSAKDDAAGYAVAKTLQGAKDAADIGASNVAMGQDLLSTADGTLSVVSDNLARIMALLEQAATGTYSSDDLSAIEEEVQARIKQVNGIFDDTFNGIKLFDASASVKIQTGVGTADNIDISSGLGAISVTLDSGLPVGSAGEAIAAMSVIGSAIKAITTQATKIGALQNQLSAAKDSLNIQSTNLASAVSTIKDADVAEESASYVQQQILQSASATLLVQANSAPQIALTLIKGQ